MCRYQGHISNCGPLKHINLLPLSGEPCSLELWCRAPDDETHHQKFPFGSQKMLRVQLATLIKSHCVFLRKLLLHLHFHIMQDNRFKITHTISSLHHSQEKRHILKFLLIHAARNKLWRQEVSSDRWKNGREEINQMETWKQELTSFGTPFAAGTFSPLEAAVVPEEGPFWFIASVTGNSEELKTSMRKGAVEPAAGLVVVSGAAVKLVASVTNNRESKHLSLGLTFLSFHNGNKGYIVSAFINPLTSVCNCWYICGICWYLILTHHFTCKGGDCDEKQRQKGECAPSKSCSVVDSQHYRALISFVWGWVKATTLPHHLSCQTTEQMHPQQWLKSHTHRHVSHYLHLNMA